MNLDFKKWDAMRIFRLIAGIGIGIYAISSKEYVFFFLAGMLLIQAILNISCCGASGCSTSKNSKQVYKDVIKTYKPGK